MLGISSSRWGIHWEWQEEKNHGVLQDVSKAASIPGFYNMYIMSCVSSLILRFYHLSRSVRPDLSRYSFSLLHRLNFKVSNIIPPQWNDCPKWLLQHDQQNILYTIKWIENDCYAWPTRAGEVIIAVEAGIRFQPLCHLLDCSLKTCCTMERFEHAYLHGVHFIHSMQSQWSTQAETKAQVVTKTQRHELILC